MSCNAAYAISPDTPILVIDASMTEATQQVCSGLVHRHKPRIRLIHRRAQQVWTSATTQQRRSVFVMS